MKSAKITPAVEDYLKAIYVLEEESQPVIAARVATEMGVSASTMFSALRRLEREGYVRVERRKEIHLTGKGKRVAEGILRRHFLTERLLTDLLGLDWVKAHQEAHRLEHAISPEVEEKLDTLLNHPTTCPHGNPIPGSAAGQTRHRPASLHQIAEGREVTLECITEGGERDARLLAFMQDHQLAPGTRIQVVETSPSLGTMSLKVGDSVITLGLEAAKKIRVQ